MKTFSQFMLEARDTVKDATYSGDAAEQERIRQRERARGFDPDAERDAARKKAREELLRKKSKNTTVPGEDIRGNKPPAGNPPPPPPNNPPASTARTPNTYRGDGVGQRETVQRGSGGNPPPPNRPPAGNPPLPGRPSAATTNAATKAVRTTVGKGILKGLGRAVGPASAVIDVADERSKGSGWLRSLAKGAVVAAGGAAGGAGGSVAGPVGTVAGAVGGSMAAGKAFDTVAGANAVERKAIATANRKSQSGGEIKGIGGPTSFSQKKPGGAAFISTGSGPQRKTVELAKTSVVTDPKSGKQEVGNLAFKGGQAVYKRADTKSLAQTSSNPFERIGRTIAAGAYKDNDAKLAAAKLATARASDATRNQKLGVKLKPGG